MDFLPTLALVAGGFFGGFFGSAVGSAGLVSLPILLLFGLSPHMAIGTTRPAAVVLEAISALRYWRDQKLSPTLLKRGLGLGIAAAVGSATGAVLIAKASDQTLRLLLSLVITTMVIFLFTRKQWGMVEHPERQGRWLWLVIATTLAGLYAGLFGFTFGTFITIIFVAFGYNLLQSAAMGRVVGALSSLASALVFASQGYVDLPYAVALAIGFGFGGWFGARHAAKAGNRYIKILLVAVVLCSVAKLLFDYFSA